MVNGNKPATKDKDLKLLIINCIITNKNRDDSISYLKEHNYTLSKPQFDRIKRNIKETRDKRVSEIANTGFIDAHLEALDTFAEIKKEMWKCYYNEQHPYKRVEILTQIANLQPYINEYYSTTKDIMETKGQEEYSKALDSTNDKDSTRA